jgi:hypothetical protein
MLILLSLLNANMGIVERPFLSTVGNNAGVRSFGPSKASDYRRRQIYPLPTSMGKQLALRSSTRIKTEAYNEKVRRIAAVALIVYVTGNGR